MQIEKKNSAANQKSAEIRKVLNPPSLLKLTYFNTQQPLKSNSSRGVTGSMLGFGSRDLGFDPPRGKKVFCYFPSCILFAAFLQFCLNMKYLFSKIVLIPAKFPGILSYFILKIQIRPWFCQSCLCRISPGMEKALLLQKCNLLMFQMSSSV